MLSKIKRAINLQEGMTLLEVLLSLALLALLATSVMSIFTPPALWIIQARNETTAGNYAGAIIEELRDERDKIEVVSDVSPEELNLNQDYKPTQPADINAHLTIEPMDGFSNLYKVAVAVNWMEGTIPREINLLTVMRKY